MCIANVHLPPMNKFARKLHGYIVYFLFVFNQLFACFFQHLKVLRHPNILRFLGWTKSVEGHRLVTEPVKPLETCLDTMSSYEVISGIYDIMQALSFLHDKVLVGKWESEDLSSFNGTVGACQQFYKKGVTV